MAEPETSPEAEDVRLPDNAFTELPPGESYQPVIPAAARVPEVTVRSVVQGFLWSVVFSAAATYLILKLGQGIESAIPISILAVGLSVFLVRFAKRRPSTLLENINVLAVGATSGIVAGGSVFTMPAIFILGLEGRTSPFQIFVVPLLGAFLGVFFLAPFRRYFVRDLHGKLPYPEGRATTEILVAGKRGGRSAVVLVYSALTAAVFDFVGGSLHAWTDNFSTGAITRLAGFTDKYKAVFNMNTSAAVMGLGYIMGLEYALIIMAGSLVSFLVLVPMVGWLGSMIPVAVPPSTVPIAQMAPADIFQDYVRHIGIGGIFAAGLISIVKMSPVIVEAVKQALGELRRLVRGEGAGVAAERTDDALPMSFNVLGIAATALLCFLYFRFSVLAGSPRATTVALLSVVLTLVMSFLFASVSAWAIAMISITPISGMTLTTLIVTAVILSALGLSGESGMLQVLLIGGVVCTALSMSGSLVTQYKIGYWLGATPRRIEISNLVGSVAASAATTAVILLMARVYGFTPGPDHPSALAAPQPNAMAAVLHGVMGTAGAPWFLYLVGAVFAVACTACGVSALAFALGMYLPMELNSPLVVGAFIAWLLQRSSKDPALSKPRYDKGTLIASGFIAGGALVGVFGAVLKFLEDVRSGQLAELARQAGQEVTERFVLVPDLSSSPVLFGRVPVDVATAPSPLGLWANWTGLLAFLLLGAWVTWVSWREQPEPASPGGTKMP